MLAFVPRPVAELPWQVIFITVAIAGFGIWGLVHAIWLPEMLNAHGFCLVL